MVLSLLQKELMASLRTCLSAQDLQCSLTGTSRGKDAEPGSAADVCRSACGLEMFRTGACACVLTWAGFHLAKAEEEK